MTKVEELRDEKGTPLENARNDILMLCGASDDMMEQMRLRIDLLISVVRAEGVAEGAEQMVNQIKSNGGQYTQKGDAVMSDYLIQCPGLAARAGVDLFIVPASVLAPTKEKP